MKRCVWTLLNLNSLLDIKRVNQAFDAGGSGIGWRRGMGSGTGVESVGIGSSLALFIAPSSLTNAGLCSLEPLTGLAKKKADLVKSALYELNMLCSYSKRK